MSGQRISRLVLLLMLALPGLVLAQEPNRAGLVIRFGDGRVETHCVPFEGEQISGADLLARSGLKVVVDTSSGLGVSICQIEGQGCAYPAEPCFCRCPGGSNGCAYWNYFYREAGETTWTYSPLGAALRKVRPGSVEAWVWGDGHTPPADNLTFEAICAPPTPTPTATLEPSPTAPALPAVPPTPLPSPTGTWPTPTTLPSTPTPTPEPPPAGGARLADYWPFGLMVLSLIAIGLLVRFRRT